MALPLALISIGSSLTFDKIRGNIVAAAVASVVNIFALPALGWIAAALLGMNGTETMIALILLACPAASSSYVMVQQLGGDEALAGSTIVISTLLSIIPLTMIVAFFGPAI
jgi:predicted permease